MLSIMTRSFRLAVILLVLYLTWSVEPIGAQVFILIEGVQGEVFGIERRGNTAWLATSRGLYYAYKDGFLARELPPSDKNPDRELYCLNIVDDTILLGGDDGIFLVGESTYVRKPLKEVDGSSVYFIVRYPGDSDQIWLGTSRGLYRTYMNSSVAEEVVLPNGDLGSVDYITVNNKKLFVATRTNVYHLFQGDIEEFTNLPTEGVFKIVSIEDDYYLLSQVDDARVLYRYRFNDGRQEIEDNVLDIEVSNGTLWISVEGRVLVIEQDGVIDPGVDAVDIKLIKETDDALWLASREMILRSSKEGNGSFVPVNYRSDHKSGLSSIKSIWGDSRGVWVSGHDSLYRFHPDVVIHAQLNIQRENDISVVEGNTVRVVGASYSQESDGDDPFPSIIDRNFKFLIHSNRSLFERDKFNLAIYRDLSRSEFKVYGRKADIYVAIRDGYGNITTKSWRGIIFERPGWSKLVEQIAIKGVLLGYGTSLVLAALWFLLLYFVACMGFFPRVRLRAYINMIRFSDEVPLVGTVLRTFLLPSWERMFALLCTIRRSSQSCSEIELSHFRRWVEGLSSETRVLSTKDEQLRNAGRIVLCAKDTEFSNCFPVFVGFDGYSEIDQEIIRQRIMDRLCREIPQSNADFCKQLLFRGSFMFVFSVDNDLVEASLIKFFYADHGDRSYMVLLNMNAGD